MTAVCLKNERVSSTVFYTYFSTKYARKSDIWAACYRVGTIANTNMYLEAVATDY